MGAESGSSFQLAFLALPGDKREALSDIYSFCREADDLADSGRCSPAEAARELGLWRAEVERLCAGRAERPLGRRLQAWRERFPFPKEAFLGVLDGVAADLSPRRWSDFAELERYMDGVAASVGYLCIEVFGYRHPSARLYARRLGHALQLTNILRDVAGDLARGRLYLPLSELARFGCSEADLSSDPPPERALELVRSAAARADALYREAREALHPEDRGSMRPAEIMAGVYERLLEKVRREPAEALRGRVRVGGVDALRGALRGWLAPPIPERGMTHA